MMRTNKPKVKKWVLPWTLLILVSVGMVGWIWREQRLAAKGGVPWGGGQDTTTPLSNHVYGIQGVIRRKLSSGDGKWAKMSLESDEYPLGIVSNVYKFPSGSRTVQVLELPGADRWLGTQDYEKVAKQEFLTLISNEKGLGEIKAILEEFPPARDSGFLYSGIHEVFVARAEFREVMRRRLLKVLNTHQVVAHKKALFATTDDSSSVLRDRVRVEQRYYQRRCLDRLERLYGALPEAVFKRLNSVHIWGGGQAVDPPVESTVLASVGPQTIQTTRGDEENPMMTKRWLWILLVCLFSTGWVLHRGHVFERTPEETRDSYILVTALIGKRPELLKDIDRLSKGDLEWLSYSVTSSSTDGNSNRTNRFWMSDAWEVASRYQFNRELKHHPEYAQILSILTEEEAVRKSSKLYTGAMGVTRILWGHREVVEDILKREIELEKSLSEDPRMDPVMVAMERELVAGTIEWIKGSFQSMTESLRQLFVDLYGGVPESTLQRLLSIEPHAW